MFIKCIYVHMYMYINLYIIYLVYNIYLCSIYIIHMYIYMYMHTGIISKIHLDALWRVDGTM